MTYSEGFLVLHTYIHFNDHFSSVLCGINLGVVALFRMPLRIPF